MRVALIVVCLLAAGCAAQAERTYQPREAPAPTGSTASAVKTPATETVAVSDEVKVLLEWPASPDPRLKTFADFYVASWKAVVDGDEGYLSHVEGAAAIDAADWVESFRGHTVKGTARLYAFNVHAVVGKGAEIRVCVDETGLRLISKSTGKAAARQPWWTREPWLQGSAMGPGYDGKRRIKNFRHGKEGCDR